MTICAFQFAHILVLRMAEEDGARASLSLKGDVTSSHFLLLRVSNSRGCRSQETDAD